MSEPTRKQRIHAERVLKKAEQAEYRIVSDGPQWDLKNLTPEQVEQAVLRLINRHGGNEKP